MTFKIRALIAAILVCVAANSAGAGIYNNAGTATREDSIAAFFQALDSLGNPVDLASGDSVYVISFGPGGWVAFKDSMAYNNARIIGNDWEDYAGGQVYTMKYAIADLDGAGVNGTYRYCIIVDDNTGANLQTPTWGEFQLYSTAADASPSQALVDAEALTYTVANEVNANMRYYEGADGVDAEIQSEVEDGINNLVGISNKKIAADVRAVMSDSVQDNGDGRLEVNLEEIADVAVSTTTAQLGVNVVTLTDGAIDDADVDNDVQVDVVSISTDATAANNAESFFDGAGYAGTNNVIPTVTTVTNSIGTSLSASEVNGDVGVLFADSVWQARISKYKQDNQYTAARFKDSVFAAAFKVGVAGSDSTSRYTGVNVAQVHGDSSAASGLEGAFDNVLDSSVRVDLNQLRVVNSHTDANNEAAFQVRNHGKGTAVQFYTDTAGSHGLQVWTTGANAEGTYFLTQGAGGDAFKISATGDGSDAIQTAVSGSSSVYDWHMTGGASVGGVKIEQNVEIAGSVGLTLSTGNLSVAGSIDAATLEAGSVIFNNSLDSTDIAADALRDAEVADGAIDWGGELDTAGSMGSTLDAGEISTIAADKIGFATNNMGDDSGAWINGADTSAMMHLRLGGQVVTASVTAGNMGSIADSVWAKDTSNTLWNGLSRFGEYNALAQAATGSSGSCSGTGAQADTIWAIDTSGTDTAIPNVTITVRNASGTELATVTTNGSGYGIANLPQSTPVTYTAFLPGYVWGAKSATTESGTTDTDSLFGYNIAISSPSAANLKRVYDYIYTITGDSAQGADVIVELLNPDSTKIAYDSTTGVSIGKNPAAWTTQTNVNGYFSIDLIPNNFIKPNGSRYRVSVYHSRRLIYSVIINAVGTTVAQVRSLQ